MKKIFTSIALVLITILIVAQAPHKMSYQFVVRNASGTLVSNSPAGVKITILQGSPTGTIAYQEIFNPNPQTNSNGLVSLEIGTGLPITGTFSGINWAGGPYFLKTETDPTGGTNYTIAGTSELLSVPYALLSKISETVTDNSVSTAKLVNNAVTIGKLPSGATNATYLRGDGTWQVPPGTATPGGTDGNIQYNYRDIFTASANLHWDYTNNRLGVGTNAPDSKVQIVSESSSAFPQLKLYESNGAGYSRINFQNSSGTTYWSINALNSPTNLNERFTIHNSVSGNVISISGTGRVGIGTDPLSPARLYVKDPGNFYAGIFENNGTANTLQVRNFGNGPAGNFVSNSTGYTLYVQNSSTGPAAYIDGTLQVAGGNTAEINRNQTGTANIVPVCYGSVEGNGAINTGGSTANFTVTKAGTGVYDITLAGETYIQSTHTAIASLGDAGFINTNAISGKLRVYTYSTSYVATDREFSFVVYRP